MKKTGCTLLFLLVISLFDSTVFAQSGDSIRISGIPHSLSWNNQPVRYSYMNGILRITAGPKTDMFRDPNVTYNTDNAPKLLFTADEDFVFSAGIRHSFLSKWDGGALVLIEDSLNWIKFCFEKDYTGAKRVVSVVTKDISDDCNSAALLSDKLYYKIAKAGNLITCITQQTTENGCLSDICNSTIKKQSKLVSWPNPLPGNNAK